MNLTGRDIEALRIKFKFPRLMLDDAVNYKYGGVFKILCIDWNARYVLIHTSQRMGREDYRQFWAHLNDVTLAGGLHNYKAVRLISSYLKYKQL
jgi:hypothetical protein